MFQWVVVVVIPIFLWKYVCNFSIAILLLIIWKIVFVEICASLGLIELSIGCLSSATIYYTYIRPAAHNTDKNIIQARHGQLNVSTVTGNMLPYQIILSL